MIRKINLLAFALLLILQVAHGQYKQVLANKTQLIHNKNGILPFKKLDSYRFAVVTTDNERYAPFIQQLQRYAEIEVVDFNHYDEKTKYFNSIIVAGSAADLQSDDVAKLLQSAVNKKDIIFCRFGVSENYAAIGLTGNNLNRFSSMVWSPESDWDGQVNAAMSIFGGLSITDGKIKTSQTRLQYTNGKQSGLDIAGMTKKIDAITQEAMDQQAAPGMMVMAIKDGQVIFEKAYGYHTYEKQQANQIGDIYDLASVSKIVGTTPVIMHLQENNTINLDSTMGYYLWQAKNTNKAAIKLRTVLLHEGGFTPFIPFYRNLKPGDLVHNPDDQHQVQVADNAFLRNNYYQEVMWPEMLKSAVKPQGNYVYSDISMYVMKEVAEHETSVPMQDYVQQFLYRPIGMKTAGYNPRTRFDKHQIVPTQNDTAFRKTLLVGYVHDEGAAMAGGVAGHAGLFGSANDLAIYGQLLLNRGEYGGVSYFKPKTIDLFTSKQSATSRRGLGFDRADPNPNGNYPSKLANPSVYGHTGYTGTCIWIDPKNQLIYIFLSNRVHPQVSTKLLDLNVRSRIQDVIYETIKASK